MAAEPTASTTETCPACGATIDTTDADPLVRVACPKCGEKVRVQRLFNNFELVETLGIGGMGTVYKARDTLLDRFVALKLLRKDLGDEIDYAKRLQQEARVAASVNHPNVVQVFSSGKDHDQFYLVMELVDHGSLDDLIEQKKRLPEELVVEAGIQVAKGLRAAYAKGLIHRDVKPANILFADEHTAKIGDFGLAGVAADTSETPNEIWGTPYYVAPERLYNRPEDFRSDIYSLGGTLFHAVSGRAPIEGDTNSATALRDLKNRPLNLRAVAPEVSEETAKVIQRMIAAEPLKRFNSYDELVAALERAYAKLTGKQLAGSGSRKMPWIAAIVAIVIALAVAAGAIVWNARKPALAPATAPVAAGTPALSAAALAELEKQSSAARRELVLHHYNVAGAQFARIAAEARGKQPLYDWSRLQQGLSSMIGRDSSQARQSFQDIEKAGETSFAREDSELAKFFVTTAKRLLASGVVTPAEGSQANATNYEAIASLLYGLKDVQQGAAEQAASYFDQFGNTHPGAAFAWINDFKPIAQRYLDDCRAYLVWKSQPGGEATAAEVTEKLARVRELKKRLKTHTPMSDDINAQEKSLAARAGDVRKNEDSKQAQDRKKLHDAEAPSWNAALAAYRQHVAIYDFAGARETLATPKLTESGLREEQAGALKKGQWLIDWKAKLIEDVNRTHFAGTITDTTGMQYTGAAGATAQNLVVKIPYGNAQLPWIKLPAKSLLTISTSFIQPNAADAADRGWLSAVFAAETGQADAARALGEEAAKAKPEYREQLPLLTAPAAAH